ncbi:uncharacterized protein LOC135202084 [Macrobrachium nipponense]|uniref:uncharacterized protein LOC135202084 n=1 Tax=Macrobrachium nipponense TaxID=159736 RepID=UPI0030C7F196
MADCLRVSESDTMDPVAKKRKQPPFTEAELYIMVTEVAKRKAVIVGSFSEMGLTRNLRDAAWQEVTAAMGSVSPIQRLWKDVRKKFKDYRSDEIKKMAQHTTKMKKTGGGPHEILALKPSGEALVGLGLLEQEAVEGLADIDDSEDPASPSAGSAFSVWKAGCSTSAATTSAVASKHMSAFHSIADAQLFEFDIDDGSAEVFVADDIPISIIEEHQYVRREEPSRPDVSDIFQDILFNQNELNESVRVIADSMVTMT